MDREIIVRGAREHNLRDVDVRLPHGKLICFTGVSGSGKSSLAFDTVYAEGQRRYLESLSSYARQFIGQLPKPDVDHLSGLSPSISISQKSTSHNPRSTVGTVTEIQDFLRVLFARVGTCFCPKCGQQVAAQTIDQIYANIITQFSGREVLLLAPIVRMQKGEQRDLFDQLQRQSFTRARVDGELIELANPPQLEKLKKHSIEVVVNRFQVNSENEATNKREIYESLTTAIRMGSGTLIVAEANEKESPKKRRGASGVTFSTEFACGNCGLSFEAPSPQLMSFNSPQGMCRGCAGLGVTYSYDVAALIENDKLSVRNGAISLLGPWSNISKANQTRLRTMTATVEQRWKLSKGFLLRTPWHKLKPEQQHFLLHGGEFTIEHRLRVKRHSTRPMISKFDGLIAEFKAIWETTKNPLVRRQHDKLMIPTSCPECGGERLNAQARSVKLSSNSQALQWLSLPQIGNLALADALAFFDNLQLDDIGWQIAGEAVKEVKSRLGFLLEVGLEYITLNRTAPTLSGGESQRIRLASQIGSGLVGVTYVLDEPSIGLHPRDNDRLIRSLQRLRDLGNTLVVVEHDEDTMQQSDMVVDFGPGPGVRGGKLIGIGSHDELASNAESLTGDYLSGRKQIGRPDSRRTLSDKKLTIQGARHHNLKNIDVEIPLGVLVCITGVSGSGKSSLISEILSPTLANALMKAEKIPGQHDSITGIEYLDKIIDIDQSPIGRTPRSNPATYVKVFDEIRNLYAMLNEAKRRGYAAGRFSFNTQGGRCSGCEGNGATRLDMEMLSDLWVPCPLCEGRRFDRETLEVRFKEKSIADVLEMDVQEALKHFENVPKIAEKLQTLHDVGLDYIKLGQPSPTLSGGEAQRIKLTKELSKRATGKTLYVMDEPTTGLHFHDISMLLKVLQRLVDMGNTVVVVEHNLDLIQAADHVIDLGLEGGAGGGEIVACGTPEQVAQVKGSYTGAALATYFKLQAAKLKPKPKRKTAKKKPPIEVPEIREIVVQGAQTHNLRSVDVTLPRDQMTVFCGRSGSGKTSLAMDTIYAEGQRRYVESLSSYARQFVGQMPKPIVGSISGLSPAVALEQKNLGHTPRSTVGTVTEIYDYLRVFMTRAANMRCPDDMAPVVTQTIDQIVARVMQHPSGTRAMILAPIIDPRSYHDVVLDDAFFDRLQADGYTRVRINGVTTLLENREQIDARKRYDVQVVVDRIEITDSARSRIADSIEQALKLGEGRLGLALVDSDRKEKDWKVETHSQYLACQQCGKSYNALTPHHFSFNTQIGWCPNCNGLGTQIGTNLDALIDPTKSLNENGLNLWPHVENAMSAAMLAVLCGELNIDANKPIGALSATQKNLLLFGSGERWFQVNILPRFSFQFRGVMPALELASKSSPALRMRLDSYVAQVECQSCSGSRVRPEAACAIFRDTTIVDLVNMSLGELHAKIKAWKLTAREKKIAGELVEEIEKRLSFLIEVGLEYLTLSRSANTLSGGEAQRIRLAAQLGSGLCGVLYVLDEPTIGLHPRDNDRLIAALHRLRDFGNTLLVVEHDRDVIANSDNLCDFGPDAGHLGGTIVATGPTKSVVKKSSGVTGPYLSGKSFIPIPSNRRPIVGGNSVAATDAAKNQNFDFNNRSGHGVIAADRSGHGVTADNWLTIRDARANTLRHIDVAIPLGRFTAVTGPSGSGKSTLINGILYPALARKLHRADMQPGLHGSIDGTRAINKVIRVDQSQLGNSPSSTPATYTGVFEEIRLAFAVLPEARELRKTARDFSFNVPGGRCEKCEGNGQCRIEMHFLADVWVECDACQGKRYNADILEVRYRGKSIYDVLTMSIAQALELFIDEPKIARKLQVLVDVGLGYMSLGQSAPTLSGGEAQRVKLAAELSRPATGKTLYLFDEPTTGLHFDDIGKLLDAFHRLVDQGNTVVVIEHNLDVIKCADWIIDLGPEAGWGGGFVVHAGTPESLVEYAKANPLPKRNARAKKPNIAATSTMPSYTGIALEPILAACPCAVRSVNPSESKASSERNGHVKTQQFAEPSSVDQHDHVMDLARQLAKSQGLDSVAELPDEILAIISSVVNDELINENFTEQERDFANALDLFNNVATMLTEDDLLKISFPGHNAYQFSGDAPGAGWFCKAKLDNDNSANFRFRVPIAVIHQSDLPPIQSNDDWQDSLRGKHRFNKYEVVGNNEWAIIEFNLTDDSGVNLDEFANWLAEASQNYFDKINGFSFEPDLA